jgi:hypothetical protein
MDRAIFTHSSLLASQIQIAIAYVYLNELILQKLRFLKLRWTSAIAVFNRLVATETAILSLFLSRPEGKSEALLTVLTAIEDYL